VEHDRGENDHAEARAGQECRADRDSVHERVQRQTQDRRARNMCIDDGGLVRLRAEVEMRGKYVLEEMDQ
jgi:hypothetical protein